MKRDLLYNDKINRQAIPLCLTINGYTISIIIEGTLEGKRTEKETETNYVERGFYTMRNNIEVYNYRLEENTLEEHNIMITNLWIAKKNHCDFPFRSNP